MIILHEINQMEMGGAERVIHGIAKYDKKNTHVVYTYKDGPMRQEFEAIGVKVLIEDEKNTDNVNCDVIHIHTGGEESHLANILKGDQPTIETIHCPVVSAVRDKYVFQRVGVTNQVTLKNRNCKTIYNGVDLDRLEESSKVVMAPALTPEEQAAGVVKEAAPVTLREFYKIPDNAFVIGRLGRLGYDKNVEEFLIACWKFQKKYETSDRPIYILIGGGEAKNARGYLARMKVAAASLPLKNVIFTGETTSVGWVYEAMDVFLYPSLNEAFGLVWMEAMACGAAVVTWQTPISQELLLGAAYITPEGNTIDALVRGLDVMFRRTDLQQEWCQLGHELACTTFTAEKMSENYQALYEDVLNRWKMQHGQTAGDLAAAEAIA